MESSNFLYVINWKIQFSFKETLLFCWNHKKKLDRISHSGDHKIVLCPSIDSLYLIAQLFEDSPYICVGAQNCSIYEKGEYTGEVSALSISQIGCEYCIVGHSERRIGFSENDEVIALKLEKILQNGLQPIICVGNTESQYEQKNSINAIKKQVSSACKVIQRVAQYSKICIAYEPVWSIGTGIVPENKYIETVFEQIGEISSKIAPKSAISFLYGGSVNEENVVHLKEIYGINGFLIGRAGLNFKKIEKIVT